MNDQIVSNTIQALDLARTEQGYKGLSLRTPHLRSLSRQQFEPLKRTSKDSVFGCCEGLLELKDSGARLIAFDWAFRARQEYLASDFGRFERWLQDYVDDWGSCDDFCTHAFGALLYGYAALFPKVRSWTRSENRWMRRAAAVVLIYAARRKSLMVEGLEIADRLLHDEDDLVRKGYGWLLKEISHRDPQLVFDYVMHNKADMPRVSLRYAVEKLNSELRQQAMAK